MIRRINPRVLFIALIVCFAVAGCKAEPVEDRKDDVSIEEKNDAADENRDGDMDKDQDQQKVDEIHKIDIIDDSYRNYYEIFVYSFYDSDKDGYGDLNGVTQKLDYIADMGYTGIWLMPVHPSPTYHKYDVTDYYDIDKIYGNLEDMKNLISEAHKRDIDIILDLVVNHTSSIHPWFIDACQQIEQNGFPSGEHKDYYNFTQECESGYTNVSNTGWFYESRFWSGMPDLNLDSPIVRDEIKNIMKYWFDLGVDGFRLDAVTSYYTGNIDKNVEFLNWLKTTAHELKDDCFLVGEAWEGADSVIRRYYDSGLDSFFIFTAATGEGSIVSGPMSFSAQNCGIKFNNLLQKLQSTYDVGIPSMFLGNHDTARAANFLRRSMPERVKMGAGILAMMPGALFTYYGEEIGMIGTGEDPNKRIAMLWDGLDSEGYCTKPPEGVTVNADSYCFESVVKQQADNASILNYYKGAMRLRNENPEIARGKVTPLNGSEGVNAGDQVSVTRRSWNGSDIIVVMNLNSQDAETVGLDQSILKYEKRIGELYAADPENAIKESKAGEYVLPPYSIMILR